jgi:hypothetical protein
MRLAYLLMILLLTPSATAITGTILTPKIVMRIHAPGTYEVNISARNDNPYPILINNVSVDINQTYTDPQDIIITEPVNKTIQLTYSFVGNNESVSLNAKIVILSEFTVPEPAIQAPSSHSTSKSSLKTTTTPKPSPTLTPVMPNTPQMQDSIVTEEIGQQITENESTQAVLSILPPIELPKAKIDRDIFSIISFITLLILCFIAIYFYLKTPIIKEDLPPPPTPVN